MSTTSSICTRRSKSAGRARRRSAPRRASAKTTPWPAQDQLTPGSALEAALVQQHLPLVKAIVARVALGLPAHVDTEDLYAAGLAGLLQAIRQYDPKAGTAFETYARVRVRGAVLDELRRMDWVPRSVHTKARRIQAVMQRIQQAKGRVPTDEEMARALQVSVDEYHEWLEEVRPATFVCLDAGPSAEGDEPVSHYESLPDQRQEDPTDGAFRHELARLIAQRIRELPEMQRKVLALYYFEDLRLREIAELFGLTESRICQIHAQAIANIKAYLRKFDPNLA